MATLTSAQHVFMFVWIIGSVAAEVLEAKPGEDVTLQCNSSKVAAVSKLVWSRLGLKEENVFFFRDNRLDESSQDPRYRGRVELKDPEMKNGDFSVVLKKVTVDDSGTYKCRVTPLNMQKDLVLSVHLIVSDAPTKEELDEQLNEIQRLKVLLGILVVLFFIVGVVVGFVLARHFLPKQSGPL